MNRALFAGIALLTGCLGPALAGKTPEPAPETVRASVSKALPLIRKAAAETAKEKACFTCHHGAMSAMALTAARRAGFQITEEEIQAQAAHVLSDLSGAIGVYRSGQGQGGGVIRAGYALWTLAEAGAKPDDTTAAVAGYLLQRDETQGFWRSSSNRPPTEFSPFTASYVSLRSLAAYGGADQKERLAARSAKVRQWLTEAPCKETEDRVFRLRTLAAAGGTQDEIAADCKQLLETQHADGGWAQLDTGESDAYATPTVLTALHQAGGLPTSDPAYRKGLAYLLAGQGEDGSWHVVSRSRPFQPYFESGFPHGKDQFISMAATCWAVVALSDACEKP